MKLLIIGACVARHDMNYLLINEQNIIQHSAQKMCWYFIEGLDSAYGCKHDVLCTMRVSSYPQFRKVLAFCLPSWQRGESTKGRYAPFINLIGMRYVTTFISVALLLTQWAWTNRSEKKIIVVYAIYNPCILAARLLCTLFRMHSFMIVPDLPEFMNGDQKSLGRWRLRKLNTLVAYWITSKYSGLVLFCQNMQEKIDVSQLQWVVVEGCVGLLPTDLDQVFLPEPKLKIIMYSGALEALYGLQILLDAFDELKDPNARLWICGEGSMKNAFIQRAAIDRRINYLGSLQNSEVVVLQRQATVLVNPRTGSHEFTRYSFPSKILEYMTSGRPVILFKLRGMPSEYLDYVYTVDGDTSIDLLTTIQNVLQQPDSVLNEIGARARNFVYSNKNYLVQGEKIRRLIDSVVPTDVHPTT